MASYDNPWIYKHKEFEEADIDNAFGFVYLITNTVTNKIYVGKKFFTKASRKSVKGKKKKIRISSDWQTYYSSSDELKEDVAKHGGNNFKREILRLCRSRSECTYWEAHYQFEYRVLLEDTYNKWIQCKIRKNSTLN